jgi:hypothetical protein
VEKQNWTVWGARDLTGERLKGVWAKFSMSSLVVLVISVTALHRQAQLHLELKTQPRFSPVTFRDPQTLSICFGRQSP